VVAVRSVALLEHGVAERVGRRVEAVAHERGDIGRQRVEELQPCEKLRRAQLVDGR
jgi:hypothetical protein